MHQLNELKRTWLSQMVKIAIALIKRATSEEIVFCCQTKRIFQLERRPGCNGAQLDDAGDSAFGVEGVCKVVNRRESAE